MTLRLFSWLVAWALMTSAAVAATDTPCSCKTTAFADSLFAEEDYFRAIGEYKRVLYFSKDTAEADHAVLSIARSYLGAGRPSDAIAWLRESEPRVSAAARPGLRWTLAYALYAANRPTETIDLVAPLARQPVPELAAAANRLKIAAGVKARQPRLALEWAKETGFPEAARRIEDAQASPPPRPWVAAFLAALIPGAGHVYAGHLGDGAYTFLLTAAFAGGTYYLASHDASAGAVATGFIGLLFYGGNIYGAFNAAQRAARRQETDLVRRVEAVVLPMRQGSLLLDERPWPP